MSPVAVIAIAVAVVVVLAALTFVTLARRSDVRGAGALSGETRRRDRTGREARPEPPVEHAPTGRDMEAQGAIARRGTAVEPAREVAPVPWSPPDPEAIGVSRRMFFNRATVTLTSAGLGGFAAAGFVGFLWPTAQGGFGQEVMVGKIDDIIGTIRTGDGFFYAPGARTWITEYPRDAIPKARAVSAYEPVIASMDAAGIVALYQKCPHLGCRVPSCATSGWFECPCHGSQYNRVGEKKAGPAPRGMDRFPVVVAGNGDVTVDTGTIVTGPPIGTNTTGQEAEGPHCITGGGDH